MDQKMLKYRPNKILNAILDQGEGCPSLYKKYSYCYKWEVGDIKISLRN